MEKRWGISFLQGKEVNYMSFEELNMLELDKDLTDEQRKEWNAIYASYRSESVLTGRIMGIDIKRIPVKSKFLGKKEFKEIICLVIVGYRVKVLIPDNEVWYDGNSRPPHVMRSMTGAVIDYVITDIDREGECCLASRRAALEIRRREFKRIPNKKGKKMPINVLAVGKSHMLVSMYGYDVTLSQKDLSYAMLPDLRKTYRIGEELKALIKAYDKKEDKVVLSVKDTEPHPFDGADLRHPVHSRRASVITGKYKGGVFCRLEGNLDCLCTYSPNQYDENFDIGDRVIVAITKHNYSKKQVYGKIVAKW